MSKRPVNRITQNPLPDATRIRRLRQERGWTQDELAKLVGCSQRAVVYYETTAKCPPAPIVAKLAAAFDIAIETMMGTEDIPTKRQEHDPNLLHDAEERRLWKRFRQARDLSERDQAYLFKTLTMLLEAKQPGLERAG